MRAIDLFAGAGGFSEGARMEVPPLAARRIIEAVSAQA